jgi:hypothetical protein
MVRLIYEKLTVAQLFSELLAVYRTRSFNKCSQELATGVLF